MTHSPLPRRIWLPGNRTRPVHRHYNAFPMKMLDHDVPYRAEAEGDALLAALKYARPLVEKWCHYQGNMQSFFDETLAPIDDAIAAYEREGDDQE